MSSIWKVDPNDGEKLKHEFHSRYFTRVLTKPLFIAVHYDKPFNFTRMKHQKTHKINRNIKHGC